MTVPGQPHRRWRRRLSASLAGALVVLSATLGFLGISAGPACACSCVQMGVGEQAAAADLVVTGTLDAVTRSDGAPSVTFTATAERVFKGELAAAEFTFDSAFSSAACGLGELPLGEYVFFLQGGDGIWTADSCGGTGALTADVLARVTTKLGAGQPWAPQTDESTPKLTRLETSAPVSLSRQLAPGAALALIGFLGLMLVRRVGQPGSVSAPKSD